MNRRAFFFTTAGAVAATQLRAQAARQELPFRQIHLDFHTSELIPDIGIDFEEREFASVLKQSHVNSINVFAKCHHGYSYYDATVGVKHPNLKKDLLGAMTRACRANGIGVVYYYSLVWDVYQSRKHPEWMAVDRDGKHLGGPPTDAWPWLCMNTPYLDQVMAENKEILSKYDTNGAFFDILKQPPEGCFCEWCVAERKKLGLSDSRDDTFKHNKMVAMRVEQKLRDLIYAKTPGAATFFNSRLVIGVRDELPYYTHIEIESLPTGGWGYSHFQQRVRYMRTLGKDMVGMTGRFHKSWGDFGGLKNQAALDFECLNFLANGTKVCVGDQLHPRGRLDPVTYSRVAKTYEKIEALEPWCKGAKALADIGVISTAATNPDMTTRKIPEVDQGFTNMLIELHHQFDVLDLESDFGAYKVLIVPDEIRTSPKLVSKVREFIAKGGGVIASHESLIDTDLLGVRKLGPAKFNGEYMSIVARHFPNLEDTPYYLYQPGTSVAAAPGTEVLAVYTHPYFDRSPEHYSSHKQTPPGARTEEPLITQKGRVIYIANPFFRSYSQDAFGIQKLVVRELIRRLLPEPLIQTANVPSTAQVTILQQANRRVVHVLHYPLTRRAPDIDIIEEPGVLADIQLSVRAPRPSAVKLVPRNEAIPFTYETGYAKFRIARVLGHQAIEIA
jgi:hypothetical protein